eukprot:15160066-Alexandrium_andersonii.AAC.1
MGLRPSLAASSAIEPTSPGGSGQRGGAPIPGALCLGEPAHLASAIGRCHDVPALQASTDWGLLL